jgi:hypothetical protein
MWHLSGHRVSVREVELTGSARNRHKTTGTRKGAPSPGGEVTKASANTCLLSAVTAQPMGLWGTDKLSRNASRAVVASAAFAPLMATAH